MTDDFARMLELLAFCNEKNAYYSLSQTLTIASWRPSRLSGCGSR
jgi:hypothetical protein